MDVITTISSCAVSDVEKSIQCAHDAFKKWKLTSGHQRSSILRKWFSLIVKHRDDLANIVTAENGKPFAQALNEVDYAASFIEWNAEEAKRIDGKILSSASSKNRLLVLRQPVGVAAMIIPWNFPLAMLARKVGPALAAGCTAIVKPSPETPLSALALAYLAELAGLPSGCLQVIPTSKLDTPAVGALLCSHPKVAKISFTGSTATGKLLLRQAASADGTLKRCSMELGGNAPFVLCEDGNVVKSIEAAKFRASGQTCVSPTRVFVHESKVDEFVPLLLAALQSDFDCSIGSGYRKEVTLGPLISKDAVEKVLMMIKHSLQHEGASCLMGGAEVLHAVGPLFMEPTVLLMKPLVGSLHQPEGIFDTMEVFGPVIALVPFKKEQDVLDLLDRGMNGLASYVYTADLQNAWKWLENTPSGMCGINHTAISNEVFTFYAHELQVAPFGGIGESGFGREGGAFGIDEYLNIKYAHL